MGHKHLILIDLLTSAGWSVEAREVSDLEWWADEIWLVRSVWHPTNFSLYITFMVDPSHDGNRCKDQAVTALGASRMKPTRETLAEMLVQIYIRPKFELRTRQFIKEIGRLRDNAT